MKKINTYGECLCFCFRGRREAERCPDSVKSVRIRFQWNPQYTTPTIHGWINFSFKILNGFCFILLDTHRLSSLCFSLIQSYRDGGLGRTERSAFKIVIFYSSIYHFSPYFLINYYLFQSYLYFFLSSHLILKLD